MRAFGRARSGLAWIAVVVTLLQAGCSRSPEPTEGAGPVGDAAGVEQPVESPDTGDSRANSEFVQQDGNSASDESPSYSNAYTLKPAEPDISMGAADVSGNSQLSAGSGVSIEDVRAKARRLANKEYQPPSPAPKSALSLNYDQYRRIQFKSDAALWADTLTDYRVFLDPRGYLFSFGIKINTIENGKVKPRPYSSEDFHFFDLPLGEDVKKNLGFSGFRVVAPLNTAGKLDEILSFRGASFFRALGAGAVYGASARGISIGTASANGEEFPSFTEFWLAEPQSDTDEITIYALLNGESLTGAFEFRIQPGPETVMDVSATFYPRREISAVGIAPLTSMYFFSPHDLRKQVSDFRPAVHDSEGLLVRLQNGEWAWRPLINPQALQISMLASTVPRGFGLIQRKRDFDSYSDIEAEYHHRPNVWIEPESGWEKGQLTLVEIPTSNEYNDNVVVFWKPAQAWQSGEVHSVSYRMTWSLMPPAVPNVISVEETRSGRNPDGGRQMFVIDYKQTDEALLDDVQASISTSAGKIYNPVIRHHPRAGLIRLSFELDPENAPLSELRALLLKGGKPVSETWLYRWRPE